MESKEIFKYRYSAAQSREARRIREKYLPKEESKLARLKKLDAKAQGAGMIEALSLGVTGILVFGIGMCFGLSVFGTVTWPAIPLGILGALIMAPAYPLYKRISNKKRADLAPEILRLSDELIRS